MKNKEWKRMTALAIAVTMSLTMAGCTGKKEAKEPSKQKAVVETENHKLTEADLSDVLTGLSDHYILQNAQNIDYLYGVQYDESIIKDIKADSDKVKTADLGKYQVTYSVKVDTVALKDYQAKKADTVKEANANATATEQASENTNAIANAIPNTDNSGAGSKQTAESTNTDSTKKEDKVKADTKSDTKKDTKTDAKADTKKDTDKSEPNTNTDAKKDDTNKTEEVEIKKDIEVIDESTAQDKANNGDLVWKDNNETVPKSDGTTVEEPTVTPPASTGTTGAATGGNSGNPGNTGNTAASGSTASSGSSNKGNTGSSGNKGGQASTPSQPSQPSQPSKPTEPAKPAHTHTWTTVAEKGHYETQVVKAAYDETVYTEMAVFPDGHKCATADEAIDYSVDSGLGYSWKQVPSGTKHHDAVTKQVWIVDAKAYTYCTGCGARQ